MHDPASHSAQARLIDCLLRLAPGDGLHTTAIPGLKLVRVSGPSAMGEVLYQPALCLLAQGSKQLLVGEARIAQDSARHMVYVHDILVSGQVVEASPQQPYLSVWLDIDPAAIACLLLADVHRAAAPKVVPDATLGIYSARTEEHLLDALLRLCQLLETPRHIPQLAPLIYREIMYRLLTD